MEYLLKLATELNDLIKHDNLFFIKTEPEIADFTSSFTGKLIVFGQNHSLQINLQNETENIFEQLKLTIFTEGMTTIFWNVKNLISFFRFQLPRSKIVFNSKVLDLKLIEGFFGIKLQPPSSLKSALNRLSVYVNSEECKKIHKDIHKPLALEVIPRMETYQGVIDTSISKYVYPSYEIEDQLFGRLNCHKQFDNCITPLNIGKEDKSKLKLCNEKDFFIYFDFKHMEVSMLQWLSGDNELKNTFDSDDLYKSIYFKVFNQACDTEEKRETIKNLFLPIMFGRQPYSLVKEYSITTQVANQIHQAIKDKFKVSWEYMESHQEQVKDNPIMKDYFGRPRPFTDAPWKVRGFLVQSASAIFCQEKLIELHNSLEGCGNLIYSIHDGYILVANQKNLNTLIVKGLKALQSESKMCKGLKLKVACNLGNRLTQMKRIIIKGEE